MGAQILVQLHACCTLLRQPVALLTQLTTACAKQNMTAHLPRLPAAATIRHTHLLMVLTLLCSCCCVPALSGTCDNSLVAGCSVMRVNTSVHPASELRHQQAAAHDKCSRVSPGSCGQECTAQGWTRDEGPLVLCLLMLLSFACTCLAPTDRFQNTSGGCLCSCGACSCLVQGLVCTIRTH